MLTHRCATCGEVKPFTHEYFRVKARNRSGLSGNCLVCEPVSGREPPPEFDRGRAWKMCGKKMGYKTREAAENVILTKLRRRSEVEPLRIYEYPICLRWHLTSKPARELLERGGS